MKLQEIIQYAAEKNIPQRNATARTKPWWNEQITALKKEMSRAKNRWKKTLHAVDYRQFQNARNSYFNEIKIAKSSCWNQFLEKAEGKEIFKAFSYTKEKRIEKLPIIKYKNGNVEEKAISFNQKCNAFLSTLFESPPTSNPPDWSTHVEKAWEWPKVSTDEIRTAIFSSSTKKSPGPEQIYFLIIQKAYEAIPNYFNQIYQELIQFGYHPKCWKTAIGVVLRKSGVRDWSNPKSYRIISLLNCLGKTAEKIMAIRLAYLAETTNLLYFDQMGGRRKKSAIDTVMTLVHDIQFAQKKKKITSALFIDVKGAF